MEFVTNIFKFHKFKIVLIFVFALIFGFILFPFGDLSDVVTAKVSEYTGGQVYLQFDDLNVSALPAPGVALTEVLVETQTLPSLKAGELNVRPWILGALMAKTGLSLDAVDLFGGVVAADYREGDKLKSGERMKSIAVDAQGVDLPNLTTFLRDGGILNMALEGKIDLSTQLQVDPVFDDQPTGNIGFTVNGLTLPSQTMTVDFNGAAMPLPLPELRLGKTILAAEMNEGNLRINQLSFGGPAESLSGQITGLVAMELRRENTGVRPVIGGYDLNVDMTLKKEFMAAYGQRFGFVFGMLKGRRETPQGTRFAFKASLKPGMMLPEITGL
ncbi:MAG: type II secretion system protein GspN [Bdellovibrionota bacterium]